MPVVSNADLQAAIDVSNKYDTKTEAAKALGIPLPTFTFRLKRAQSEGLQASGKLAVSPTETIKRLERELKEARKESADALAIKAVVGSICEQTANATPPAWLQGPRQSPSSPGVPLLFLSDLHWGENVRPGQINGVNEYNLDIARTRLKTCVTSAVHLLSILSNKQDYPGIVVPLGGDMISGDIHEELAESNDLSTIPTVLDLYENLIGAIGILADQYGAVFLPCVTGNHGRNTKKIRAKDRHHTSFDWMLYQLLARHFQKDKRITFHIPDGPDAAFRIYATRYNLTHGDQFRGGDGMIGALGPIMRGDHKKRSRNSQIDLSYDIAMMGHWHQYMHLTKLLVNGSLKGYDEYANSNNFSFEPPQQSLHLTHPKHGVTYRMPVYCDPMRSAPKTSWVSVPSA